MFSAVVATGHVCFVTVVISLAEITQRRFSCPRTKMGPTDKGARGKKLCVRVQLRMGVQGRTRSCSRRGVRRGPGKGVYDRATGATTIIQTPPEETTGTTASGAKHAYRCAPLRSLHISSIDDELLLFLRP